MTPNLDKMTKLVMQSRSLQSKMPAKKTSTCSKLVNQEEALVNLTEKALNISSSEEEEKRKEDLALVPRNVFDDFFLSKKTRGSANLSIKLQQRIYCIHVKLALPRE